MPHTAILYIAERCNQSCVFCLEEDGSWTPFVDPTTTQTSEEITRLWNRGARHITFMGGETFFRKDLGRLLSHARDVGFTRVGVTTNGTVLSKKGFLRSLVDSGLGFIELSIHGHTPELANAIAGTSFTFERQSAAMAELDELGSLTTIVNVVACRENARHLVDVARYVSETFPRIPARFKFKFVSLQGLAAERAHGTVPALAYDDVDFAAIGDYLVARGKPVWFYNVPLCRLGAHAGRSAELASLAGDERYFDFEHRGEAGYYESGHQLEGRVWPEETCSMCTLRPVCPGLEETHRRALGAGALRARDDDPLPLLRFALADRGGDPAQAEARLEALRKEPRPARFARSRPEGALRFVHAAEAQPFDVTIDPRRSPSVRAFAESARFSLSYRAWEAEDPARRPDVAALLSAAVDALTRADAAGDSLPDVRAAVARVTSGGWAVAAEAAPAGAARRRHALPVLPPVGP